MGCNEMRWDEINVNKGRNDGVAYSYEKTLICMKLGSYEIKVFGSWAWDEGF